MGYRQIPLLWPEYLLEGTLLLSLQTCSMAVDPTYPLYSVFSIICAALMLLVLMTSFIRNSWNLGVSFLCFWIFWELLFAGIDSVIWSNNAEIKFLVYCDIGALQPLLILS
jgi:hypothetical protein